MMFFQPWSFVQKPCLSFNGIIIFAHDNFGILNFVFFSYHQVSFAFLHTWCTEKKIFACPWKEKKQIDGGSFCNIQLCCTLKRLLHP
jgi:hypothetical protein